VGNHSDPRCHPRPPRFFRDGVRGAINRLRWIRYRLGAGDDRGCPWQFTTAELTNLTDERKVLLLPERYGQRLRTTNAQERLNAEIRRRERVLRIFPNRDSVIRLLEALLLEIHERWTTGTCYLDREESEAWSAERTDSAPTRTVVAMR